jgi:hypothetical protein
MPETKEETFAEIERLEEWCIDMWEMLLSDGTVPASMVGIYTKQVEAGQIRLEALKQKAKENEWTA